MPRITATTKRLTAATKRRPTVRTPSPRKRSDERPPAGKPPGTEPPAEPTARFSMIVISPHGEERAHVATHFVIDQNGRLALVDAFNTVQSIVAIYDAEAWALILPGSEPISEPPAETADAESDDAESALPHA